MGYDLIITREQYSDNRATWVEAGAAITPEEWLAIVQSDAELTPDKLNEKTSPLKVYWSGPGKYPCWLDYSDGRLYSKNPTDEMIDKMVQIAKLLDATVVGEEGEEYLGDRWVTAMEQIGRRTYRGA